MNGDEGGGGGDGIAREGEERHRLPAGPSEWAHSPRRSTDVCALSKRGARPAGADSDGSSSPRAVRGPQPRSAGPENQRCRCAGLAHTSPSEALRGPLLGATGAALRYRHVHPTVGADASPGRAPVPPHTGRNVVVRARARRGVEHTIAREEWPLPPSRSARTHLGRAPADEATDADIVVVCGRWGRDGAALHGAAQWGEKGGREE
jgi:hypothetical protein